MHHFFLQFSQRVVSRVVASFEFYTDTIFVSPIKFLNANKNAKQSN